ncbi:hypothetical protein MMC28_010676 [Mycoblastus sanguinarius]|nr:hypothetical protein [Mycoblastus sanguinarius]
MSAFNRLLYEIREKIFLYALHCEYTPTQLKHYTGPQHPGFVGAYLRLSQVTLSALKLVNRQTYHKVSEVSKTWLGCATVELLEELEAVREFCYALVRRYDETCQCNAAEYDGDLWEDSLRYEWISQVELPLVVKYRTMLERSAHRTWKRMRRRMTGTEYLEGFCEFFELCSRPATLEQELDDSSSCMRGVGRLEMQQTVCFGPRDSRAASHCLDYLLDATGGVDNNENLRQDEPKAIEKEVLRMRRFINYSEERWTKFGFLPQFRSSSELSDWWRPYPTGKKA